MTLEDLLTLAERDTVLEQLRHRRDTLPEREQLVAISAAHQRIAAQRSEISSERAGVAAEEKRLDDEASSLESRATDIERRMYSGEITSPKELQAMQADVEQLQKLRSGLEDSELEVMGKRENLDAALNELTDQENKLLAEQATVTEALSQSEQTIDSELAEAERLRAEIASQIEPSLVAEYEKSRAKSAGAARLSGVTCEGCRLSIPTTEAERIRKQPAGTIEHCPNCGCILVS